MRFGKIHKVQDFNQDGSITSYNKNNARELYVGSNLCIDSYRFKEDNFLYVHPLEEAGDFKTITVFSGRCKELKSQSILEAGDLFVIDHTQEMTTFYMLEETVLILHSKKSNNVTLFRAKSLDMVKALVNLQNKDFYTKEHSDRVYHLAKAMGLALGYHSTQIHNLNKAALFHDIGKVQIEDAILNKRDPLTSEEFSIIRTHVSLSSQFILSTYDHEVLRIVLQHHERIDGSGYPDGLTGEAICPEAKILAICDSYDAMTTDRIYKRGKSKAEALIELDSMAGQVYDAELVALFIQLNS